MGALIRSHGRNIWTNQALGVGETDGIPLTVGPMVNGSVHVGFTGSTLMGTVKLQVSNSPTNIGWTDYPGAQPVSGTSSFMFNLQNVGYGYARLVFIGTSGTGTAYADAWIKSSL
jgi:hypothetical protein